MSESIKTLITREELAKRWPFDTRTIQRYESDGILTRNPNFKKPTYYMEEVLKLEGSELNPLSPLERRRLEKEIENLKKELTFYKEMFSNIKMLLVQDCTSISTT